MVGVRIPVPQSIPTIPSAHLSRWALHFVVSIHLLQNRRIEAMAQNHLIPETQFALDAYLLDAQARGLSPASLKFYR